MTTTKEDYLIEIYRLEREHDLISTKQLSLILKVSAPSVSEMLGVLFNEGYIEYTPYRGSRLTSLGRERAKAVLHSHHVWEDFLMGRLGYDKSEAHNLAHELEHVTNSDLIQRLEIYLKDTSEKDRDADF